MLIHGWQFRGKGKKNGGSIRGGGNYRHLTTTSQEKGQMLVNKGERSMKSTLLSEERPHVLPVGEGVSGYRGKSDFHRFWGQRGRIC